MTIHESIKQTAIRWKELNIPFDDTRVYCLGFLSGAVDALCKAQSGECEYTESVWDSNYDTVCTIVRDVYDEKGGEQ